MTSQEILDFTLDGIRKALLSKDESVCRSILSDLHTEIIKKEIEMRKQALVRILAYQKELSEKYPQAMPEGKNK